jgi:hypothetical protein
MAKSNLIIIEFNFIVNCRSMFLQLEQNQSNNLNYTNE